MDTSVSSSPSVIEHAASATQDVPSAGAIRLPVWFTILAWVWAFTMYDLAGTISNAKMAGKGGAWFVWHQRELVTCSITFTVIAIILSWFAIARKRPVAACQVVAGLGMYFFSLVWFKHVI